MKIKIYILLTTIFLLSGGIFYKQTGIFCQLSDQTTKEKIEITDREIIFKSEKGKIIKKIKYINRNNSIKIAGETEVKNKELYDEVVLLPKGRGILLCHYNIGYEQINSFVVESYDEKGQKIGKFEPYERFAISPNADYIISYMIDGYTLNVLSFLGKMKIHLIDGTLVKELSFTELEQKSGVNKIVFTENGDYFALGIILPGETKNPNIDFYVFSANGNLIKRLNLKSKKEYNLYELEKINLSFNLTLTENKLILSTNALQFGYDGEINFQNEL